MGSFIYDYDRCSVLLPISVRSSYSEHRQLQTEILRANTRYMRPLQINTANEA